VRNSRVRVFVSRVGVRVMVGVHVRASGGGGGTSCRDCAVRQRRAGRLGWVGHATQGRRQHRWRGLPPAAAATAATARVGSRDEGRGGAHSSCRGCRGGSCETPTRLQVGGRDGGTRWPRHDSASASVLLLLLLLLLGGWWWHVC
jgi:hypothetical protein